MHSTSSLLFLIFLFLFAATIISTTLILCDTIPEQQQQQQQHHSNQQQQQQPAPPSSSFTASIPQDRTVCDALASRLSQDEIDTELSRLLPASMRIRKGVIRQSRDSRSLTPMYITFSVSNQSFYDEMLEEIENVEAKDKNNTVLLQNSEAAVFNLLDARLAADTVYSTLMRMIGSSTSTTKSKIHFWKKLLPPTSLRSFPNFDIPFQLLLDSLVQAGLTIFSATSSVGDDNNNNNPYDGIPTLTSHLSLGRLPIIRFVACRSNATDFYSKESSNNTNNTIPWQLVTGYPYERYTIVVGVDLDHVIVVVPSIAEDAIAIPRAEFLSRWRHTEKKVYYENKEELVVFQRPVAAVLKPVVVLDDDNDKNESGGWFQGIIRQLTKPPQVVEFDGFC